MAVTERVVQKGTSVKYSARYGLECTERSWQEVMDKRTQKPKRVLGRCANKATHSVFLVNRKELQEGDVEKMKLRKVAQICDEHLSKMRKPKFIQQQRKAKVAGFAEA